MIEPKEFCHDEIVISDVHTSEQNLYRFKASVPAKQVDNFLFSIVQAAKSNSHEIPAPEEAAKLLMSLIWEEFAYRSDLRMASKPTVDFSVCNPHLKASTEFSVCLEGPLYPPCSLEFLEQIHVPVQEVTVDDYLVEQEIGNQKVLLGADIPFEYPIQRGDTLQGELVVLDLQTNKEVFKNTGSLMIPLSGDHFAFDSVIFENCISFFLGRGEEKIVGETNSFRPLPEILDAKSIQFVFTTSSARRCEPASNETILKHYQMTSDSELWSSIQNAIENRLRDRNQRLRESSLCDQLLKFAPPLTSRDKSILRHDFELKIQSQHADSNLTDNELGDLVEKSWNESAENLLNQALLNNFISLLGNELDVGVREEDLLQEIRLRASAQGVRPEKLRKTLVESDQLDELQSVVSHRAVLKELLRRTTPDK